MSVTADVIKNSFKNGFHLQGIFLPGFSDTEGSVQPRYHLHCGNFILGFFQAFQLHNPEQCNEIASQELKPQWPVAWAQCYDDHYSLRF
jgi:hypothetical protein